MDRPGFEADRLHITLFNRIKQTNRRICDSWDRSPDSKTDTRIKREPLKLTLYHSLGLEH